MLNWGLGHATRSVPVIQKLLQRGYNPVIASDGKALAYLKKEFPQLTFAELPAYNIRYSTKLPALLAVMLQTGNMLRVISAERRSLKRLMQTYRPVAVISDNRLGCYTKDFPSVFITHQLKLPLPFGRKLVSRLYQSFINKFDECWVPDFACQQNLSGELSHSLMPRIRVRYIGALSRFASLRVPEKTHTYDACILLSGPEPQRSILEGKILNQLKVLDGNYVLIRGAGDLPEVLSPTPNIKLVPFAEARAVAEYIRASKVVVSRSGYSSIMDYYFLKNKALLIPTPGQPEQEYLARYHLHKGVFLYTAQQHLDLEHQLKEAETHAGLQAKWGSGQLEEDLFSLFERK